MVSFHVGTPVQAATSSATTLWTVNDAPAGTQTKFEVKVGSAAYHSDGTKTMQAIDTLVAVRAPEFSPVPDGKTGAATIPYTPGLNGVMPAGVAVRGLGANERRTGWLCV